MGRFQVGFVSLVALLSSSLLACSAAPESGTAASSDDDLTAAPAAIAFAKGSENATGTIFEGETVKLTYALERTTSCTKGDGDPHHGPQFDYTLFYRWNGASTAFQSKSVGGTNGAWGIELTAPFHATDLEVYVQLTNPRGCSEYDSSYGKNFHFPVGKARLPAIHFEKDGAVTTDGALPAGSDVLVDYASLRLENCNQSGRKLKMFGRVDGLDLAAQDLAEESRYGRTIGRLHTNEGAKSLELWFETVDFHACTQWDSNGGANFRFDLQ